MSLNSDTFIVFGEMQAEDMAARAQQAALEQQLAQKAAKEEEAAAAASKTKEEGNVDADGMDEEHINTVMSQASVTRSKAIESLKKNDGDVVNAIMELTLQ